jgi:hypothetical protein
MSGKGDSVSSIKQNYRFFCSHIFVKFTLVFIFSQCNFEKIMTLYFCILSHVV